MCRADSQSRNRCTGTRRAVGTAQGATLNSGQAMAELSTIARPYAEALFTTARNDQASSLESWSGLVSELAQVASQEDVREALTDPRLNAAQRIELFAGLIKSPLSAQARNFIELLVSNNRILVLPQIA